MISTDVGYRQQISDKSVKTVDVDRDNIKSLNL